MDLTSFTLRLLLLLAPGVICALIVEQLTVHKPWSEFRFVLYSFVLGVCAYVGSQLACFCAAAVCSVCTRVNEPYVLVFWDALLESSGKVQYGEIIWVCVFAIPQSLVIAAAVQWKWLLRVARWMRVTDKYGDENLFYFTLAAKEMYWVYVRAPGRGLSYFGSVDSFSETERVRELVLNGAEVYRYEDSTLLYKVDSIYLSFGTDEVMMIERPMREADNASG